MTFIVKLEKHFFMYFSYIYHYVPPFMAMEQEQKIYFYINLIQK